MEPPNISSTLMRSAASDAPQTGSGDVAHRVGELARLLQRHAPEDGINPTAISRLSAIRFSAPSDELVHALHQPAVCIIAQGAKRVLLRDEVYSYDASRFLVFTTDLPISAQVTHASRDTPYLCFRLDLDPAEISEMVLKLQSVASARAATCRGLYLSRVNEGMLDAAIRLMRLLDSPHDAATLAPLALQELVYRLLRSEQGERLAQASRTDSHANRIARAIAWLKANFEQPLRIDDLARDAHMSPSSLHHHFRAITAMSPLQYQKQLRLQEARRLLLADGFEVAKAGYAVGYESASQFSREYSRLFGVPPSRDAQRLREGGTEPRIT
ncbi:AraC family transcriptional regulator [Paucibacter sp. M5-1]|uniref:AraC family transcriptional regulator n=1 Tax=Paucibacter sp. M5-1 TaxID=3015998 RepID=UPI0022B90736|nr:AraC family transcriptional regulator [Paucibacter sp. M5-1]MCZ7880424.1 AraC family transcriptional regulator [Paucibacter sp. M5-1]